MAAFLTSRFGVRCFAVWFMAGHGLAGMDDCVASLLIFVGPVLWLAFFAMIEAFSWVVHGYYIYQNHAENLVYKERGKGNLNFYITLRLEISVCKGVEIHVPSERSWKSKMPAWAAERRGIILRRLEKECQKTDNVFFLEDGNR